MGYSLAERQLLQSKTEFTGVHPQKFALWLAMASMTMFFAALTSALLLKKGDFRSWEGFKLPNIFLYSTIVVIALSSAMQLSLHFYKKSKFLAFRGLLLLSFVLGLTFLGLQLKGWQILTAMGLPLTGNLSGSFIYLITAMHGFHLAVGLGVLLVFLIFAIRSRKDPLYELRNIINPKRQLNLELLVSFWHYIDAVWVYLYIFFYINY
jgi:cytochrome c oxidase subunit 3